MDNVMTVNPVSLQELCVFVAAMIHYFYLVGFAWMLFEGVYLYLMVVKVFNTVIRLRLFYGVAWGKYYSKSLLQKMACWQIQSRGRDLSVPSGIKSILLIDSWFILLSLRTQGRTIRKVMGEGWGIFELQEFFFVIKFLV